MEFRPCELPHVFSSADVGYVGRATDNVPPQGEGALPLYKLHDSQRAPCGVHGVEGTRTWSRPTGVFPRARSRDGGLDATVAYLRSMAWARCVGKTCWQSAGTVRISEPMPPRRRPQPRQQPRQQPQPQSQPQPRPQLQPQPRPHVSCRA
jgi:hypothetical protein